MKTTFIHASEKLEKLFILNIKWVTLTLIHLILIPTLSIGQNTLVQFEKGSWNQALKKAKSSHKQLFLVVSASWCGPCRVLKKEALTNDSVASFLNNNFINYYIDADKGEGKAIAKKFHVEDVPHILFINSHEIIEHAHLGLLDASKLINVAKTSLDTLNNLHAFSKRHNSGDVSPAFIHRYLNLLTQINYPLDSVLMTYSRSRDGKEAYDEKHLPITLDFISDIESKEIQYLVKHPSISTVSKQSRDKKLDQVFSTALKRTYFSNTLDSAKIQVLKQSIQLSGISNASSYLKTLSCIEKKFKDGDLAMYYALSSEFSNGTLIPSIILEHASFTIAQKDKAADLYVMALPWAESAMNQAPSASNTYTYALLLKKNKLQTDAIKYAELALERSKNGYFNTEAYKHKLEDIKRTSEE